MSACGTKGGTSIDALGPDVSRSPVDGTGVVATLGNDREQSVTFTRHPEDDGGVVLGSGSMPPGTGHRTPVPVQAPEVRARSPRHLGGGNVLRAGIEAGSEGPGSFRIEATAAAPTPALFTEVVADPVDGVNQPFPRRGTPWRRLLRACVLFSGGCLSLACAVPSPGPVEWSREVPEGPRGNLGLLRILDAESGGPIPGARVTIHPFGPERRDSPRGEPFAEVLSDGDGWVLLPDPRPADEIRYPSLHVAAEGYGSLVTDTSETAHTRVIRMHRPGFRIVEVRDFHERPLDGVTVVLAGNCGACPLAPRGVTGPDGCIRLGGVDPLWLPTVLVGEKRRCDLPLDVFFSGDPGPDDGTVEAKRQDHSEPGRTVVHVSPYRPRTSRGRVIDHEGRPVPGVRVGRFEIDFDRWVETDAEGRFAFPGFAGEEGFEAGTVPLVLPPEGFETTVRLPPPGEEPAEVPKVAIRVRLDAEGPHALLDDVPVWVVSDRDGFTARGAPYAGGDVIAEVPAGPCTIVVGNGLGRFLETRRRAVAAEGGDPVVVRLQAKPTLRVRLEDFPEDGEVHLWTEAGAEYPWDTTKAVRTGAIVVPPEGDAVLVLEHDGRAKRYPIPEGRIRGGEEVFVLAWPSPKRVRARFVAPDGRPAVVRADVDTGVPSYLSSRATIAPGCRGSEVEVPTRDAGPCYLVVEPEDEALAGVAIPVAIPREGEVVLDLGTLRLGPRSERQRVYLRGPVGFHFGAGWGWFPGAWAEVERPGGPDFGLRADDGEEGCAGEFLDLREGDWILLPDVQITGHRGEGEQVQVFPEKWSPPSRVRLAGPGPWDVPWPSASIRLAPVDEAGRALGGWECALDTGSVRTTEPSLEIFGLEPGPHRLLVEAPGHVSREVRVLLLAGELRDLSPVLRRR